MNFSVIETETMDKLFQEIAEIKATLSQKQKEELLNEWLPSETVRKMLKVCQKTWQNYRDKKIIAFSQFGSKIYVKRADLEAFLQKHYIKSEL